jgi:hypothetical protein
MAKILDQSCFQANIQKVVETPLGFIMNGSYYDKAQWIPKKLQIFPVAGDLTELSMSQKLMTNHAQNNHGKSFGDTVANDRYDNTVCYFWVTGTRSSNKLMLFKIRENNGTITTLNSNIFSALPTTSPFVRAYLGQDTTYLYYLIDCNATWREYFVKIDKNTLTMTTIEDFSTYSWGNLIKETDTYIYYARKQGFGTNIIKRYNKMTAVIDTFAPTAKTSTIYFSSCYSNLLSNSSTDFYTFAPFHNSTTNKFGITRYHFDTTQTVLTSLLTESDCNITWGTVTQLPVFASSATVHYEPFISYISSTNKYYLNIAIYEINGSTSANLTSYGIYTFLIDSTTKDLTFKNFTSITSDYFRGFIGVQNNTFLACVSPTATIFANFDPTNEKFIVTNTIANAPTHIGADQSDGIWIVNALTEIEFYNTYVPINFYMSSEMDSYNYGGTNISSYITIQATNWNNVNIACNLQLTIKGGAVFTSNGSKVITDTTLTSGSKQIPITITSDQGFTISPQYII